MMNKQSKQYTKISFKDLLTFILYVFTGTLSCFFAFVLVLNFLNPAISEEQKTVKKDPTRTEGKGLKKTVLRFLSPFKKNFFTTKDISQKNQDQLQEKMAKPQATPMEETKDISQKNQDQLQEKMAKPQATPREEMRDLKQKNQDQLQEKMVKPQATPMEEKGVSFTRDDLSAESLEIQSIMVPFIYEFVNRRDPFDDPTVQQTEGFVIIPQTPPEEFELSQIELKGIIWDIQSPKALFLLPGNAGYYTLIRGDKIGKQGVIFEIRENEVVIVETTYIKIGENKKQETVIRIKKMNRIGF